MRHGPDLPIGPSEVVVNIEAEAWLDLLLQGSKASSDSGTFDVAAAVVLDDLHT